MSENQFSVGEKATHFIIGEVAKANTNFRQVLWTGKHSHTRRDDDSGGRGDR